MADHSFLPDDFDENNSLFHRIRRQASNLLRSPSKPPTRRRTTTPARTPTEESFTPYLPLANRHERSNPPTYLRRASFSSSSSAEASFPPTPPVTNIFPIPYTTDPWDGMYESDIHIIPFIDAKAEHRGADAIDLSYRDTSDVIPDSPTLPPSLAPPLPVPELVLAPTPALAEAKIAPEPQAVLSRPHPTIQIPPAPSYPPPISPSTTLSDSESKLDGDTLVGDTETMMDFELEPTVDRLNNCSKHDMSVSDWTLHLSCPTTWSCRTKHSLSGSSRPNSSFCMDWTLELPASRPPTPMPSTTSTSLASAQPGASSASTTTPSLSPVSQCPSSWLSIHPHPSVTPFLLRKPKSSPSLLPLPGAMAHPQPHPRSSVHRS